MPVIQAALSRPANYDPTASRRFRSANALENAMAKKQLPKPILVFSKEAEHRAVQRYLDKKDLNDSPAQKARTAAILLARKQRFAAALEVKRRNEAQKRKKISFVYNPPEKKVRFVYNPGHGTHYNYFRKGLSSFIKYYLKSAQHKANRHDRLYDFLKEMYERKYWYSTKSFKWRKFRPIKHRDDKNIR